MQNAGLQLEYLDFKRAAGRLLGPGFDEDGWSNAESTELDQIVNSGYRRFLSPDPVVLPGHNREKVHQWNFLEPVGKLQTESGQWIYQANYDFGHLTDKPTFQDQTEKRRALEICNPNYIRRLRNTTTTTGRPTMIAAEPLPSDGKSGQRWQFLLHPEPDATYVLDVRYSAMARLLSTDYPIPLGGAAHSETIKAAVLAEAERVRDDEYGVHNADYLRRLVTSIVFDNQHEPKSLGYNGDTSGDRPRHWRERYSRTGFSVNYVGTNVS